MFTANEFRAKAAEYAELLKNTDNPSEIKEFQRSKQSFSQLAHNEDWLAANFDKIIHSQEGGKSADQQDCRRNRGAYSSLPRSGSHRDGAEDDSDETPARVV